MPAPHQGSDQDSAPTPLDEAGPETPDAERGPAPDATPSDVLDAFVLADESGEAAATAVRQELAERDGDTGHLAAFRRTWETWQEQFRLGNYGQLTRAQLAIVYPVRLTLLFIRRFVADKLLVRASSLAFFTVLSLIPLMAVAASLLVTFGRTDDDGSSFVLNAVQEFLGPSLGTNASQYIVAAIERATDAGVGATGALALVFTAVMLFFHIERVFNDAWHVERRRPVYIRVLFFYALVTLGPVIMSVSVYHAASVGTLLDSGLLTRFTHSLGPLTLNTVVLCAVLKFLPSTRVYWRFAVPAAIFTTLGLEIAKIGFTGYASRSMSGEYALLYGPLVLIPLILVWVYTSWIVVLSGNLLCYCMQNMRSLLMFEKLERNAASDQDVFLGSSIAAIEIFAPIARAFAEGDAPIELDRVSVESGYATRTVDEVLRRLEAAGIILEVEVDSLAGFIPALPLSEISLELLLETLEVDPRKPELADELRAVVVELRKTQERAVRGRSARDLLPTGSTRRGRKR